MRGPIDLSIPSMSEILYAVLLVVFIIAVIALFHTEVVDTRLLFIFFLYSALYGLRIITLQNGRV
jgi:hypothetical protein